MPLQPVPLALVALAIVAALVWALAAAARGARADSAPPEVRRRELAFRERFAALRRQLPEPAPAMMDYAPFWREVLDLLVAACGAYREVALAMAQYLTRHRTPPNAPRWLAAPAELRDFDACLEATLRDFWLAQLGPDWLQRLEPIVADWTPDEAAPATPGQDAVSVVQAGGLVLPAALLHRVVATVATRLERGELPGGDAWEAEPPLHRQGP